MIIPNDPDQVYQDGRVAAVRKINGMTLHRRMGNGMIKGFLGTGGKKGFISAFRQPIDDLGKSPFTAAKFYAIDNKEDPRFHAQSPRHIRRVMWPFSY
jgi:hypothetical protein